MRAEEELGDFLIFFAGVLKEGYSPEYSFQAALAGYRGPLRDHLHAMRTELANGRSFDSACDALARRLGSDGCSLMLRVIKHFTSKGGGEAGERIMHVISMLKENRELVEERARIMRSFGFRVRVITLACTAASAFLASLSPFLMALVTLKAQSSYAVNWPATVFLQLSSAIASYYAACAVLMRRPYLNALLSLIVFSLVFLFSSALTGLYVLK
ncbi:TPA: hypothetical protein EYP44_02470 [Candidatus Bathyarchaeota archaeon]|nr:hypothetical protein [Candidatus Bathyarchaeota archaeon]